MKSESSSIQSPGQDEWSSPKPEVLAEPTWWPAALAFGSTLLAWGLVTSFIIAFIGLVVFAVSLTGWIRDIRHEQAEAGSGHGHHDNAGVSHE